MRVFIIFLIVGSFVGMGTSQICLRAHEVYRRCSNGCETTCRNFGNPQVCVDVCLREKAGCYCEAPYVRNDSGECVLTSQCKTQRCPHLHEQYLSCSNGCQTTCRNFRNPPICIQQCSTKLAGCYCIPPYVRSDKGDCVAISQCRQRGPR